MPDHLLGESRDLDQGIEIDTGFHAHLLAQKDQVFGANVAGCALVSSEWTSAQATDRRIEITDTEVQARGSVGDRRAARVVQVQADLKVRPTITNRADEPSRLLRIAPAHGVGKGSPPQRAGVLFHHRGGARKEVDNFFDRDRTLEIAAEGGRYLHVVHLDSHLSISLDP